MDVSTKEATEGRWWRGARWRSGCPCRTPPVPTGKKSPRRISAAATASMATRLSEGGAGPPGTTELTREATGVDGSCARRASMAGGPRWWQRPGGLWRRQPSMADREREGGVQHNNMRNLEQSSLKQALNLARSYNFVEFLFIHLESFSHNTKMMVLCLGEQTYRTTIGDTSRIQM